MMNDGDQGKFLNMRARDLAFASLALFAVGCGNSSEQSKNGTAGTQEPTKPALQKLNTIDTKVGTGPAAKAGDLVIMEYTGKLVNGTQFDSNANGDKDPYSFVLGQGSVVKGWDVGIVGMKKGGLRRLEIPSAMGYGPQANGDIPANSDLYFDIKMLDLVPAEDYNVFDKKDLKVGTGAVAKMGDTVTVHYTGKLSNDKEFENTYESKKPATFELGTGASTGFDAAVAGMRVGGKRWMRLPPAVGYGMMGKPPKIPSNSVIYFEVELLSVKPKK